MIETMCNEILGNYRHSAKRRLNRVMDALNLNIQTMKGLTRVPIGDLFSNAMN
jgi:hypothetical protein